MAGEHTRAEILSQPDVWRAAAASLQGQADRLHAFFREGNYDSIVFTGCGSTYYLALAAAALTQDLTGKPARGVPASEAWLYPSGVFPPGDRIVLVAVSRSGETTETLRAGESFLQRGHGDFVTLSCDAGSALAQMGKLNLAFPEAQEKSIAQTRAFSTLYVATVLLAAAWSGRNEAFAAVDGVAQAARRMIQTYGPLAADLGRNAELDRFYFLGSGPRYGLACELNLKMKEMSLSVSEAFHFLEFRHGPMSMVTPSTLLVGLLSEQNRDHEWAVLEEMRQRGARLLVMAEAGADVAFQTGIDAAWRNVLYLPVGQLLAFERSLHNGLDPDRPTNLNAVVKL